MIGIYKIISPTNRVYIGQSIDIYKRFEGYNSVQNVKNQKKLHSSFLKHGVENHVFEVIEECTTELLNERERYWQEYYNVIKNGLNCKLTNTIEKKQLHSSFTKLKIRASIIKKRKEKRELSKIKSRQKE
jgi:group I intron endonuclease